MDHWPIATSLVCNAGPRNPVLRGLFRATMAMVGGSVLYVPLVFGAADKYSAGTGAENKQGPSEPRCSRRTAQSRARSKTTSGAPSREWGLPKRATELEGSYSKRRALPPVFCAFVNP